MTCEAAAEARATFEECRRIEAEPGRKDQPFGEREAIEAEDEIDRELGAAAVADLADVEALGEQRVEHRRGVCRDLLIAADQADAVALADLLAGARHRHFEKAQLSATRAPSAAMRSGSQVEVQITILPAAAGTSARSTTSST